jgi:hypothetical protein
MDVRGYIEANTSEYFGAVYAGWAAAGPRLAGR